MTYLKSFILSFCFLICFNANAQFLEEQTEFSKTARGEAIFVLGQGQQIYTYEPEDSWYKARKAVYLKMEDLGDKRVSAGTVFYNKDEEVIGRALQDLKLYDIDTIEGFRKDDRIKAVIQGYVFKTKIVDGSIPEEALTEIFAIKNRNEQQRLIKSMHEAYGGTMSELDEMEIRVIYEDNKVSSEEKDFRLIMVFRGTSPYAIITNDHTVDLPKIKELWEQDEFRVYYFYKASASQKARIEELIYNFLAL